MQQNQIKALELKICAIATSAESTLDELMEAVKEYSQLKKALQIPSTPVNNNQNES